VKRLILSGALSVATSVGLLVAASYKQSSIVHAECVVDGKNVSVNGTLVCDCTDHAGSCKCKLTTGCEIE
jgi:hypothetical protein